MSLVRSVILWSVIDVVAVMTIASVGCVPPPTTLTGNVANGQAIVTARCTGCHRAGGIAPPLTAADANLLTNNLVTLNVAMAGLTLTDQEVADVRAFLATQ